MSKIYSQNVSGKYRTRKDVVSAVLLFIYFASPWMRWHREGAAPSQAILIDLPMRRGYFFDFEIWPEEVFYITAILIIAAFGLFLFTSMFGRIWCGYTCPHTVLVDYFIKIETFFQGDRNARMRLDNEAMTRDKMLKKAATHMSWLALSFLLAFGWVCYFYDAPTLVKDLYTFHLGTASKAWLWSLTASTYLFGGFLREKMCNYMCPYGRFQSVMLDKDSLIVTYHDWRGEPRSNNKAHLETSGDCIDCNRCVLVCPMGIDIRDGLQMLCINCGLCIDACNEVMAKIGKELNLISYDSVKTTAAKKNGQVPQHKFLRPKTLLYGLLIVSVTTIIAGQILYKINFTLLIARERGPLFTITADGMIRNTYDLTVTNKSLIAKKFCLSLQEHQDYLLKIQHSNIPTAYSDHDCFTVGADSEKELKAFVKSSSAVTDTARPITFILSDVDGNQTIADESVFIFHN